MKIINNSRDEEVDYILIMYPDGQKDIELTSPINKFSNYTIVQSITNFEDIHKILCAAAVLKNHGITHITLDAPYIMGLRSDRAFVHNGIRYIKDILAPILNTQNFSCVLTADPHSYVAENCINNLEVVYHRDMMINLLPVNNSILLSPDAGAMKKCSDIYDQYRMWFSGFYSATKVRKDHNIFTSIPSDLPLDKDITIIDDICDGGGTFLGLKRALKDAGHKGKIFLIVTHGIFSKGLDVLTNEFDMIITTNSYNEELESDGNLKIVKVW